MLDHRRWKPKLDTTNYSTCEDVSLKQTPMEAKSYLDFVDVFIFKVNVIINDVIILIKVHQVYLQ